MSHDPSPAPDRSLPPESPSLSAAGPTATVAAPPTEPRLRLWPGLLIVATQWLAVALARRFAPGTFLQFHAMFMGPMVAAALFAVWWLFASRAPRRDRWLTLVASAVIGGIAFLFFHKSMGAMTVIVFVLPTLLMACALWLLVTPFLRWPVRRTGVLVVVALAWTYYALVRFEGIDGSMKADLVYRWRPTTEETFLSERGASGSGATGSTPTADSASEPLYLQPGDWPGFRGPDRDARLPKVLLAANWDQRPPREVWRHRVGPGWSSFAVIGDRLYTQEQVGEEEAVLCYDATTGRELWVHRDKTRFEEVLAGPGPRATPTFHLGKIFAQGANGRLNCLDAATGSVVWTRDIAADADAKVPMWGFASSPLIVGDIVTIFAGGEDKAVLAYRAATGEPVWSNGKGEHSYCSTQLSRLAGVEQLVIATDQGLAGFEPDGGKVLWSFDWPLDQMYRVVQPAVVGDSDLLLGTGMGMGTQRVHVVREGEHFKASAVWDKPTLAIRPYYNDLVVHRGHIYGFDGTFFACVNLEDGKGVWKARGYGNGQVLLLPDADQLVILSETGEVALVDAKPDMHKERCKFQAIAGKTWNHPVIAHGRLFVRNGEEAACFELEEESGTGVASNAK